MQSSMIYASLILSLAVGFPACSFTQPIRQKVSISTDVPATIYIKDDVIGETSEENNFTITHEIRRNRSATIRAESSDGKWARGSVDSKLSVLGILDIIGGFIILAPFATLFTGHAFELTPVDLKLKMSENKDTGGWSVDGIID